MAGIPGLPLPLLLTLLLFCAFGGWWNFYLNLLAWVALPLAFHLTTFPIFFPNIRFPCIFSMLCLLILTFINLFSPGFLPFSPAFSLTLIFVLLPVVTLDLQLVTSGYVVLTLNIREVLLLNANGLLPWLQVLMENKWGDVLRYDEHYV